MSGTEYNAPHGTTWLSTGIAALALAAQAAPQQPPTFRASTELVLIEAQVVTRDGTPVQGLKSEQFEVFVDGRRQPIVNLEFIRTSGTGPTAVPPGTPEAAAGSGRTIVVAIDQESFPVSGQASAREAAMRVVKSVAPDDNLGLIAFPGPVAIAPTRDHAAIRAAICKNFWPSHGPDDARNTTSRRSEASRLKSHDAYTKEITDRECKFDPGNMNCSQEVIQDGGRIADALERQAQLSISGLRGVLDTVGPLPGRKTLMLISAGLPMQSSRHAEPRFRDVLYRAARRRLQHQPVCLLHERALPQGLLSRVRQEEQHAL